MSIRIFEDYLTQVDGKIKLLLKIRKILLLNGMPLIRRTRHSEERKRCFCHIVIPASYSPEIWESLVLSSAIIESRSFINIITMIDGRLLRNVAHMNLDALCIS